MLFATHNIVAVCIRQGFVCAACGKQVYWWDRPKKGTPGKWHPHRMDPQRDDRVDNLVILCTTPPQNCHFNVGHGGISLDHYEPLVPEKLPCIRGRSDITWDITWKP